MRYDTYTPDQIDRLIAYCDQRLKVTRSADRRLRLTRKRADLVAARSLVLQRRRTDRERES
jgi:hypothetical protein